MFWNIWHLPRRVVLEIGNTDKVLYNYQSLREQEYDSARMVILVEQGKGRKCSAQHLRFWTKPLRGSDSWQPAGATK
jgi:hypothetical protein